MLNEKELLILSHLRENSRESLAEISRKTGIAVTTVYDILHRLKRKNVVDRYVTLLDFPKMGFSVRVNLVLKTDKKTELINFLKNNPNINSIHKITNGDGFLVDAVFRNLIEYEFFKEDIEKFELMTFKEHYIIDEIKREGLNIL